MGTTRDEILGARINSQKGGCHVVTDTAYIDIRFATLENMLKGLVLSQTPNSYPAPKMVSCFQCQSTDHSLSACPLFAQQLATSQEQGHVNVAFKRPKFGPYSSSYNPWLAKHLIFHGLGLML